MRRLATAFVTLLVAIGALLPACGGDDPCGASSCDWDKEFCATFGTDVPEAENVSHKCYALPDACKATRTCGCFPENLEPGFNLGFCLEAGGCSDERGRLTVICPGG